MQPKTPKLLEDIRDAASFIADSTRGIAQDAYTSNRMLRQSVERNFEIMGEATRRLTEHDPVTAQAITGYKQIIAFRNILIHGYDSLDHSIVWQVIQRDLPILLAEIALLLAQISSSNSKRSE